MRSIFSIALVGLASMVPVCSYAQDDQTSSVRRVVTALDDSGKAVVLFDNLATLPVATQQPVVRNFWTLNQFPAVASMKDDLGKAAVTAAFGPGPQRAVFRTVDFPPAPPPDVMKSMDANMFMKMAGDEAPKKGHPPGLPFTHRTKTIDFGVVVSGEIDLVLDDSTVHLTPGDVVVQQETNHAWVNRGTVPCRISFVEIEATEP
jgi:mannose-6-phosphate isomerase-like protein (cupin superfamily)